MTRRRKGEWSNWSGSVRFTPAHVAEPGSVEEVRTLVREVAARRGTVRPVGSSHSFTPLIASEDVLISLDRLQGVTEVDHERSEASVLAGTKLKHLGHELARFGVAQENLGDVDAQSIAGAVSTGTHGTGRSFGSLSTQIVAATLVTAAGDVVRCSASDERAMFEVARLSLGSIGVLIEMTLRVQPAFVLHHRDLKVPLEDCLGQVRELRENNRHFEFFWFPHTDLVHMKIQNETTAPPETSGLMHTLNEVGVTNGVFRVFSEIARAVPRAAPTMARLSVAGLRPEERVSRSHEVYATRRLVRFQEMEYALPVEELPDAVRAVKEWIAATGYPVHFPVECRFGPPEDVWLAPAYGRETGWVAVHAFRGMPYEEYFRAAEEIFRAAGGRPHWGKMHHLGAAELERAYPRWADVLAVRDELDPEGLFLNDHLRNLFGIRTARTEG